jgi:hypothetical protein
LYLFSKSKRWLGGWSTISWISSKLLKNATFIFTFALANRDSRRVQTGQSKAGNQSPQAAQVDGDSAITIATQELINQNQSVDEYNLRRSNRQGMAHRMQPQRSRDYGRRGLLHW